MKIRYLKSGISIFVILFTLTSGRFCYAQVDNSVLGDQYLLLARTSTDRDSVKTALKSALEAYNEEIEINPRYARAYAGRGETNFLLGDYRSAILDCRKSTEIDPSAAEAYCILARAEQAVGDFRSAIRDYGKAIDNNPHHSGVNMTYYYRGFAKSESGNDAAALADYNKSLEIAPVAIVYLKRGISKVNLADRKGACLDFNKAIELGNQEAGEMVAKYCK